MKLAIILCEANRSHRNFAELVNYFNSANLKPEEMLSELDEQIKYWIRRKKNYEYELASMRRGRPNLKTKKSDDAHSQLMLANCRKISNTINRMLALKKQIYQHLY
jgi:predicted  nucleic acid-binding Zn-ribbon protein